MTQDLDEFENLLKSHPLPEPDERAKKEAIARAMAAFDKKISPAAQGSSHPNRLMDAVHTIHNLIMGRDFMKKAYIAIGVAAVTLALLNTTQLAELVHLSPEKVLAPERHKEHVTPAEAAKGGEISISPGSLPAPASELAASNALPPPPPAMLSAPIASSSMAAGKEQLKAFEQQDEAQARKAEKKMPAQGVMIPSNARPEPMTAQNRAFSSIAPAPNVRNFIGGLRQPYSYQNEGRDKFEHFNPNGVKEVRQEPVSTFSIDVDTASYSFMRASLNRGELPQPDAVRTEELINYFPYNYEMPESRQEPFKANIAVMPTPWNPDTKLLRIGIKGYDLKQSEKPHANLVFLLDTSGSMNDPMRLPLVVNAMKLALDSLRPDDTVAIVTYAGTAGVALEPTPASDKEKIVAVLNGLYAEGSTAGFDGLQTAYKLAEKNFDPKSVNRVILSTDGDFNVGVTDQNQLKDFIAHERDKGIYLSVLGVGQGNYNDAMMQTLAKNGNGVASYIDNLDEARKVLIEEAGSTLFTIAKDVKIQVEFNPGQVAEYRLIGYESGMLNREDFNNDKVDAGGVGAGHAVTALYEITPVGSKSRHVDPLRYQKEEPQEEVKDSGHGEYAFVKIRYKLPGSDVSKLISTPVTARDETKELAQAPADARWAAAVAAFGQLLKGDANLGTYSFDDIMALAKGARGEDADGYRAEFVKLVELAKHEAGVTSAQPPVRQEE